VGLNLQRAASACINLELPRNPAVLEQRIGRIHRLGQERPIDVYNLLTRGSIEERIAGLVADKRALFKGLFDGNTDELRFDGGSAMSSVLQGLAEEARDSGAAAPDVDEDESAAAEASDESSDATGAPEPMTSAALALEAPAAPPPSGDVDRLFGSVSVRRRDDGGVVIEAPPDAARALVSVFEGMARLMAAAAPPMA
jgi:hypothetical protein